MTHQTQQRHVRREPLNDPFTTVRSQEIHAADESDIAPTPSPTVRSEEIYAADESDIAPTPSPELHTTVASTPQPTIIEQSPSYAHVYPTPTGRNAQAPTVGSSSAESTGGTTGLPIYSWILIVVGVAIIAVFLIIQVVNTHRVRKKRNFQELHSETILVELDDEPPLDKKIKSSPSINFGYPSRGFQKLESEGAPDKEKIKLSLSRNFSYPPRGFQKLESEAIHQTLHVIPEESESFEEMSCNARLC
jgi:hypothetical protein